MSRLEPAELVEIALARVASWPGRPAGEAIAPAVRAGWSILSASIVDFLKKPNDPTLFLRSDGEWAVPPGGGGGVVPGVFTATEDGLAPASGGGAVKYLRADGTWEIPPGTGGTAPTVTLTNAEPGTLVAGTPVSYFSGARKASATVSSRTTIAGVVLTDTMTTLPTSIMPLGSVELTTLQWDAVTGGVGGLLPGALYYVDTTDGKLTLVPPSAIGQFVIVVGQALSTTMLFVHPEPPVLL